MRIGKEKESYAVVLNGGAVSTQNQLLRGACVLGQARNGEIFMVEVGVIAEDFVCLVGVSLFK